MYILTEWCAKVVMAYAMIKKGTRTCHAKQWPSPKYLSHSTYRPILANLYCMDTSLPGHPWPIHMIRVASPPYLRPNPYRTISANPYYSGPILHGSHP